MIDKKYQKCLYYIEKYWGKATFSLKKDTREHLGLPNPFVSPNASKFNKDQFYWDSYFIILGLVVSRRVKLAKGMIDNFVHLYDRLGFIPVRNFFINLAISQPPFLTSMILEVYECDHDKQWLKKVAVVAEDELLNYWQDGFERKDKWPKHCFSNGLSHYAGSYRTSFLAEYESGWDETSRFFGRALDFATVDLNSLLYKYEVDLALIHKILGNKEKQRKFLKVATSRKKKMSDFFWNRKKGFFFDHDEINKKQSSFWSLAGFYPLWAGVASREQAARVRANLKKFEMSFGLANTGSKKLLSPFRQWDYPNGWPNQQWIVIKGLLNYGYKEDALRLAEKWLDLNVGVFEKTGKLWEKYDVVKGDIGLEEKRYETQSGFGWTNGVFLRLYEIIKDNG